MSFTMSMLLLAHSFALTPPTIRGHLVATPALLHRIVPYGSTAYASPLANVSSMCRGYSRRHGAPLLAVVSPEPGSSGGVESRKPLATFLGWTLTAGAMGVFLPIILRLVRTGSSEGFSKLTWALHLVGNAAFMMYPVRAGYARSTYSEYIPLMAQSLAINCLIRAYAGVSYAAIAAGAVGFLAAYAAALRLMPVAAAKLCVPVATALLSTSLVPQVLNNLATHSSGGWSGITAAMGAGGNLIRLYTTMQLAKGDRLLLAQFGLGLILNGILLLQVIFWGA